LGHVGVTLRVGNGSRGWAEHAPFDRILVTAAAKEPPQPLLEQLKTGGRMVMPIGPDGEVQHLSVVEKITDAAVEIRQVMAVRFTQLETVA
jgi:protein-L-isoaspartate(D-aspartate) O-methyltransferase